MDFQDESFDIVISTEVIEHTVSPFKAISEMSRILRPGGLLLLTVPNKIWHFSVVLANFLKLRPYEGYENWVGWNELKNELNCNDLQIEEMCGFHVFPFVSKRLYRVIDYFDSYQLLYQVMLNIAVRARKL